MTRREWHNHPKRGKCWACGKRGRLHAHHVMLEQHIERIAPERRYDTANRMLLGWSCCHYAHHNFGVRDTRIPQSKLPLNAILFIRGLLGVDAAQDYLDRHYPQREERRCPPVPALPPNEQRLIQMFRTGSSTESSRTRS